MTPSPLPPLGTAVSRLEAERKECAAARKRSLFTRIETSFLKRPHPFASIFMFCMFVVVVLVFATTAVERIELPLMETLVAVRERCATMEKAYFEEGKGKSDGGAASSAADDYFLSTMVREFGDISTSAASESSSASSSPTKPTLPWPLPKHYRVLFNVLVLTDEYSKKTDGSNGAIEGGGANAANAGKEDDLSSSSFAALEAQSASQLKQTLFTAADRIVEQIEGTVAKAKGRIYGSGGEENGRRNASSSSSSSSSSSTLLSLSSYCSSSSSSSSPLLFVDIQHRVEVATIRETAFDEAVAVDAVKSLSTSGASSAATPATVAYREKLIAKEKAFLTKHYPEAVAAAANGGGNADDGLLLSADKFLSPTLRAAARVATTYELPHRYRMPLPPTDGHPTVDAQITFIVKKKKVLGARKELEAAYGSGSSADAVGQQLLSCTPATTSHDHYACVLEVPYVVEREVVPTAGVAGGDETKKEKEAMGSAQVAASIAHVLPLFAASTGTSVVDTRVANAVGTLMASVMAIDGYKSPQIARWHTKRAAQSCARSFAYLKRVMDLLEEHPRAAFPEELRPLWNRFTENFFAASSSSSSESPSSSSSSSSSSYYGVAAAYLHQLLSHPSLIPEQTFPLEQQVVMYTPLLLPFIGALMQCVITLAKYKKIQKALMKEAEADDAEDKAAAAAEAETAGGRSFGDKKKID